MPEQILAILSKSEKCESVILGREKKDKHGKLFSTRHWKKKVNREKKSSLGRWGAVTFLWCHLQRPPGGFPPPLPPPPPLPFPPPSPLILSLLLHFSLTIFFHLPHLLPAAATFYPQPFTWHPRLNWPYYVPLPITFLIPFLLFILIYGTCFCGSLGRSSNQKPYHNGHLE